MSKKAFILEACVDSVESAVAAKQGGANRLELCANLVIGGTTPSLAMFEEVSRQTGLDVNVLIRPRFGDFCYTADEVKVMCRDIELFKKAGANGVVFGCLNADATVDTQSMKKLRESAGDMFTTMHRAFDVCADPYAALEQAIELKMNAILTSGRKNVCTQALDFLADLVKKAGDRIDILEGGITDPTYVKDLIERTGASNFHLSGHSVFDSPMTVRYDVYMGAPGIAEFEIYRTEADKINTAYNIIKNNIK
ncbi:MAG: copper homeostasis protein CutC [Clostridia bacterium]|nr:copper homeostasis protein CutC [Clostridia bacterium]